MQDHLYLAHHGILGMKWGVRRFQNPDGSLTSAGKKRYLQKDGSFSKKGKKAFVNNNGRLNDAGLSYYNSEGYGLKRTEGRNAYLRVSGTGFFAPTEAATGKDIEEVSARMKKSADHLAEMYGEATDNVQVAVREVASSKEMQNLAQKYMKDAVGPMPPERAAWDVAYTLANEYAFNTPAGKKVTAYEKELNAWWDNAEREADRIMETQKDVVIGTDKWNRNEYTYKDVVYSTIVDSAPIYFASMTRTGPWEPGFLDNSPALDEFANQILAEYKRNTH